ncbi:MAG TPA: ATP-binding cassette domain-containing protein, partial [Candidatus Poseidoniales archaeon]|nr:ATP-binding cassette domain-containing protein [Candidatus Poseidoniales archaeon]
SGVIRIGQHDIRELTFESLRRSIALVAQRVTLFPTNIRENIRYGRPEATDEEVREAAEIAEATEFIERLPEGWDTEIGEGGQRLSGGQAQRLAIARAVLKDAPILILDEATSSVDNETEAALQRSLSRISKQRTTMIIAHRLSTIVHADKVVVMEQGRISEEGTHSSLLEEGGVYRELWAVQSGERMGGIFSKSLIEDK